MAVANLGLPYDIGIPFEIIRIPDSKDEMKPLNTDEILKIAILDDMKRKQTVAKHSKYAKRSPSGNN